MLRDGGTAVDASIAALVCNGVYNSQSMGLGGGFLMTYYNAEASNFLIALNFIYTFRVRRTLCFLNHE